MSEKLEAYYGLPSEVKFCQRCVISNQRPSSRSEFKHDKDSKTVAIHFDEEGICDACRYHEKKAQTIDFAQREEELKELCDRYRRNDGRYSRLWMILLRSCGNSGTTCFSYSDRKC